MQIKDGWNGFLVDPTNKKQLGEKIKYLILKKKMKKIAEVGFGLKEIAESYL